MADSRKMDEIVGHAASLDRFAILTEGTESASVATETTRVSVRA